MKKYEEMGHRNSMFYNSFEELDFQNLVVDQYFPSGMCPMDFQADKDMEGKGPLGINRLTRHASLWSFGYSK